MAAGRRTTRPRLHELEAESLGAAVVQRVETDFAAAVSHMTPEQRRHLRSTVARIVEWARDARVADGDLAQLDLSVGGLRRLLYGRAVDPDDLPLGDPAGLALVAASARLALASGQPVTARQLAALGACDPNHVRWCARETGSPRIDDGLIRPAEARRWLAGRGVPLGAVTIAEAARLLGRTPARVRALAGSDEALGDDGTVDRGWVERRLRIGSP